MKAARNPNVRGLIVVSNDTEIQKIQGETEGLAEDFRKRLKFVSVEDVNLAYDRIKDLEDFKGNLGLGL